MTSEPPKTSHLVIAPSSEDVAGVIALLAHDLRSPSATIISTLEGVIDLNEDNEALAPVLSLLRGALAAAYRQHNMVSDLLDLPRLELGQTDLERLPLDLAALIRDVLEFEQKVKLSKRVTIVSHIPADLTLMVNGEEELLRRIFFAIFDNTAKFTLNDARIDIDAQQAGDTITLTLTDNGRIISPNFEVDILSRLSSWNTRFAGSRTSVGAGLPYASAVVRAHGGTMTAKSDSTTGKTTFTITLPAYQAGESDTNHGGQPTP